MKIRPEEKHDYEAIYDLIVTVFCETFGSGEAEAHLVDQLRQMDEYVPSLSKVAILNGRIVGHALFSRVSIVDSNGSYPALALGPLGVLKEHRRRGIGSALVCSGINEGRTLGYQVIFVQGSPRYYGRFGFVPLCTTSLATPFTNVPRPDDMVLMLIPGSLGRIEGKVEYPSAWDVFM